MAYSKAQEARLSEFDEVTYDQAVALAKELGYSLKSVISKVQSLEIPYVRKEVPAPKPKQATKAEILAEIQAFNLDLDLSGLIGASRVALVELVKLEKTRARIQAFNPED